VLLRRSPGRGSPLEVTIYKSVGAAFLDAATARLAYDQAGVKAVGTVYAFDQE
jgi:ornithine cyclodeaminase/alanine dehydrogenase-like protein (mu-crystallin family)